MRTRRTLAAVLPLAVSLVLVTVTGSGCRPSNTNGTDTATVFVTDTLATDSLGFGVWEPETLVTHFDSIEYHQDRLRDAFFEYDSNDLNGEALDSLAWDAAYLMANRGFRVLLEGHCDERGTIDYNLALGERRAVAAYNYLLDYGVDPSRLETVSYGKERPFVLGSTEEAWAANRRVHFRVLPPR
ncbi:OmpA family protein [Candidatus Fermentibacterales bacterium]|nr:OmpA family protein [Candidatus Fermentibacterales bacterium]